MATLPQCPRCERSYSGTDFCTLCRIADLEDALRNLVDKLDAVQPTVEAWAVLAHVHGQRYDGPNYAVELQSARELLGKQMKS